MKLKVLFLLAVLGFLLPSHSLFSQEDNTSKSGTEDLQHDEFQHKEIDSVMAISPDYMPVYYTYIQPHFFLPVNYTHIDTTLWHTHQFDPIISTGNLYQNIGVYGQAHKSMVFSFEKEHHFSLISLPYPEYFKKQSDIKFYDVQTSFTDIAIAFGISNNYKLDAVHTQKFKGVTVVANLNADIESGYFLNQGGRNFTADFVLNYEIPSKFYGFTVSYIFNRINQKENGGLINSSIFMEDKNKTASLVGYPVKSNNAKSLIVAHDLMYQQYVNIINKKKKYWGTITHSFQFQHLKTDYLDYAFDSLYYNNVFYNRNDGWFSSDTTRDTMQYYSIINSIQWSNYKPLEKMPDKNNFFRIAAGMMHEYVEAKCPYYIGNTISFYGRTHIRLLKVMDIYGNFIYSFLGYNNNDATLDASIQWAINRSKRHFIGFEGYYSRKSPDYFYSSYLGNNYRWDSTWNKQNNLQLGTFWSIYDYKVSLNYYMVDNLVTLNDEYHPFCVEKPINIVQLNLYAPFRIKGFGLIINASLQYADKKYIQLPLFAGKASTFYTFKIFKRKLKIQIGFDMMYNTQYYADGYSSILHQFYFQEGFSVGNYFYLDANLTLQIKRLAFFFRAGHFLSGIIEHNYFFTADYPAIDRRFQLGITWKFYD